MSVDWFTLDLGILAADGETGQDALDTIRRHAAEFVAAGGVLSWREWRDLSPASRSAFLDARTAYDAQRAVDIGTASQGPQGAAEVLARVDGGALKVRLLLERMAAAGARQIQQEAEAKARGGR